MSRSDFFQNAFGFEEQAEYAVNQKLLLSKAVFETSSINVEIPLVSPYSETKSNITAVVVKERCRIFHSDLCDYDEDPRSNTPGKANLSTPFDRTASSTCKTNDHFYLDCGTSWTPSVEELRSQVRETLENKDVQRLLQPFRDAESEEPRTPPSINRTNKHQKFVKLSHVIGDSRTLHTFPTSRYGLFQAASQFNYLEFPSPDSIPENGITKYIYDPTQGPACAIACAAGTAYRNYLATVCPDYLKVAAAPTGFGATRGQRCDIQFNGLDDIERYLASIATDVGNQGRSDDSTRGFHPSNRSLPRDVL